jgi:hypothetical protein
MGSFTAQNNDKVVTLVLYAPLWTLKEPPPFSGSGAYRTVNKEGARARGLRGIPDARKEEISPQAWFDKWWNGNLATDPAGAKQTPPILRAPNGVLKDIAEFLGKGIPLYNPSDIRVSTLLIVAMGQDTLFILRRCSADCQNTINGKLCWVRAHAIVIEKNRMELINVVHT